MEERGHVNSGRLGVLGEAVENVEDVLGYVVAAADRHRIGDDGALIAREARVHERSDKQPGQKANVVDAVDKILGAID